MYEGSRSLVFYFNLRAYVRLHFRKQITCKCGGWNCGEDWQPRSRFIVEGIDWHNTDEAEVSDDE